MGGKGDEGDGHAESTEAETSGATGAKRKGNALGNEDPVKPAPSKKSRSKEPKEAEVTTTPIDKKAAKREDPPSVEKEPAPKKTLGAVNLAVLQMLLRGRLIYCALCIGARKPKEGQEEQGCRA